MKFSPGICVLTVTIVALGSVLSALLQMSVQPCTSSNALVSNESFSSCSASSALTAETSASMSVARPAFVRSSVSEPPIFLIHTLIEDGMMFTWSRPALATTVSGCSPIALFAEARISVPSSLYAIWKLEILYVGSAFGLRENESELFDALLVSRASSLSATRTSSTVGDVTPLPEMSESAALPLRIARKSFAVSPAPFLVLM